MEDTTLGIGWNKPARPRRRKIKLNPAGDEIRRQEQIALVNARAAAAKLESESNVPETEVKPA